MFWVSTYNNPNLGRQRLMNCTLEKRSDGYYYCTNCNGNRLNVNGKRQCVTTKGGVRTPTVVDAKNWMAQRYNSIADPPSNIISRSSLLNKIDRCREADCSSLVDDICVTMGSSCKMREHWFNKLCWHDCENWAEEDERIRIGFLTPGLKMGGAERWIIDMAKYLDKGIFKVVGIGVLNKTHVDQSVVHIAEKTTQLFYGKYECSELSSNVDIIIYWGAAQFHPPVGDLAEVVGAILTTLVYVSHGLPKHQYRNWVPPIGSNTYRTAVSNWAAQIFPPDTSVTVLHNGVDTGRLVPKIDRTQMRQSWGFADDVIAIGHIGRRGFEKNPMAVALAASTLGDPYRAVYVGSGIPLFTNRIQRLCPGAIIRKPVEQIGDIYNAIDCFLLASPSEGFSLALIEAWICGLPVISTNVGAIPELEERFGRLVSHVPIDPTGYQLAEAVKQAMSEENQPIVKKAQAIALEHFTGTAMADRWSSFLQDVHNDSK